MSGCFFLKHGVYTDLLLLSVTEAIMTPKQVNHFTHLYTHDLDLWPLTLITFSAIPTHTMNICGQFHRSSSTKYRDIASREIAVNGRTANGRGQPDGRPEYTMALLPIDGCGCFKNIQNVTR